MAACVPDCAGKACGGDGCGGSCGTCEAGLECNYETGACGCGFFTELTYRFDGSALNWTTVESITLNATHTRADGTEDVFGQSFDDSRQVWENTVYGCDANLRYKLDYSVRAPSGRLIFCERRDIVSTSANITFPAPTISGPFGDETCEVPLP